MLTVAEYFQSFFCSVKIFEGSSLLAIVVHVGSVKIMHRAALGSKVVCRQFECDRVDSKQQIHSFTSNQMIWEVDDCDGLTMGFYSVSVCHCIRFIRGNSHYQISHSVFKLVILFLIQSGILILCVIILKQHKELLMYLWQMSLWEKGQY